MAKPTQATIFRKRQVLPARGLNKALQEYGSAGGSIPYLDDGTQDGSMTAPLGTKTAPFGNAFFKGFNIYTETEVQALVEAEKITSDDRFVFWDLSSNSLKAWDGEKIVSIGGSGGNMEYIFGNGQDGNVTMVSSSNYDTVKNFTNFTLNTGVTLSRTSAGSPLIIKCTGTCTLNGTINLDGKGWEGVTGADGLGYGDSFPGLSSITKKESGNYDANMAYHLASLLAIDSLALLGGAGGGCSEDDGKAKKAGCGATNGGKASATSSSLNLSSIAGGNGGGGILIIARKIILNCNITAKGNAGTAAGNTNGRFCSGGGGGGSAVFIANEITDNGTYDFSGGSGGKYQNVSAPAGGTGGYVKVII